MGWMAANGKGVHGWEARVALFMFCFARPWEAFATPDEVHDDQRGEQGPAEPVARQRLKGMECGVRVGGEGAERVFDGGGRAGRGCGEWVWRAGSRRASSQVASGRKWVRRGCGERVWRAGQASSARGMVWGEDKCCCAHGRGGG
jgi:hypothetical protein